MSRNRSIAGSLGLFLAAFLLAAALPLLGVSDPASDSESGCYELLPAGRLQSARGELSPPRVAQAAPLASPSRRLGERLCAGPAAAAPVRLLIHRFNE